MNKLFAALAALLVLVSSAATAQSVVFSPRSIVVNPRPTFDVEVWLDKDRSGNDTPVYQVGEEIRISVRPSEDAYIYLFNVKSNGEIVQILPNRLDEGGRSNFVTGGQVRTFPPQGARYTFQIDPPRGLDKVIAVASKQQLDTSQLARFEAGQDPNFARSSIGEQGFAERFSIVVRPVQQAQWVTDTALFYVGAQASQPSYGTLAVSSSPRGAEVYVDGDFVGYTPVSFGDRPGRHEVEVRLDGYQTYRETVNVRPGTTTQVDARLTQVRRTGTVSFDSSPSGAEVYVDGRFIGTTPTSATTFDQGRYQARFTLPGYQEAFVDFTVSGGTDQNVRASLRSLAGTLVITANVGGAQVFLDGRAVGTIPSGSGRLTLSDLSDGFHEVTVVAPGFTTVVNEVRVRAGETTELRVRQERR